MHLVHDYDVRYLESGRQHAPVLTVKPNSFYQQGAWRCWCPFLYATLNLQLDTASKHQPFVAYVCLTNWTMCLASRMWFGVMQYFQCTVSEVFCVAGPEMLQICCLLLCTAKSGQ